MKICIPTVDDRGHASTVHPHFGSAPFFTLIEVDSGDLRSVANPACRHEHGSCHHVGILGPHGVDAVVCTGIGRRALTGLREQGVEVLITDRTAVADVLAACRANAVRPLAPSEACGGGRHRHGCGHRHAEGPAQTRHRRRRTMSS